MLRVGCLLYDGFALMDVAGPLAAFEAAGHCGSAGYTIELLAATAGPVVSSGGQRLIAEAAPTERSWDTLLIPGGAGARDSKGYEPLLCSIKRGAAEGRRIVSICSGAFLLAEAGLLANLTAATHWMEAPQLARQYPDVRVDAASLFVEQGNIWTSAGISAGIDLALALIERDYGTAVAQRVAQVLVVPLRRPGNQTQHSALLELGGADDRFNELLIWMRGRLANVLDVESLASRMAMSPRHFSRTFRRVVGISPAKAVERMRIEVARSEIEGGQEPMEVIARQVGFLTPDRMRDAFVRICGVTPQLMRRASRQS